MKLNMKIILRIGAVAGLIIVVLLVILYNQGYYDISFIKRPPPVDYDDTHVTSPTETLPADTSSSNLSEVYDPDEITSSGDDNNSSPAGAYEKAIDSIADAKTLYAEGWLHTGDTYTTGMRLLKITPEVTLPEVFSYARREVKEPMRVESANGGYNTVMRVYSEDAPAVEPYMGYIFVSDGKKTALLSPKGEKLIDSFNLELIELAYARDVDCAPLFRYEGGYYKYNSELNMLISVAEKDIRVTGLSFDYQYSYGRSDGKIMLFRDEETGKYGYKNASGRVIIEAEYDLAYEFGSGSYAAVIVEGVQKFIDRSGRVRIDAFGRIYYNNIREVYDGYYPPDTNGIESLGMYYFDHGLVRVRRHLIDFYHHDMTADDMDLLIDENGDTFPLPGGYTLVAYSNGVILLEKDGLYGYLDHTGSWIAQPIYTYAQPFSEGIAAIGFEGGKKGYIDTAGNIVLPFVFDYVSSCSGGVLVTYENEHGWLVFNKIKAGS